jgi:hypothetical protein
VSIASKSAGKGAKKDIGWFVAGERKEIFEA